MRICEISYVQYTYYLMQSLPEIPLYVFPGAKSKIDASPSDYENIMSVDNEAYDQSSIVTSPSKVGTLLMIM